MQDTLQTKQRQGKRKALARPSSARPSSAKARAGHPSDQAVPEQSQDTRRGKRQPQLRQADRCQGTHRTPTRASSAGGPYCAKPILLRIQFVRENLVCRTKSFTDPVLYGRPRPCRTKSESQASTSQLRQADRRQGTRGALARPSSAKVYKPKSPASMETGDFSCRDPELLVAVL